MLSHLRKSRPQHNPSTTFLALVATLLACLYATPTLAQDPPRPNIVVIFADDLGYADVSFNGATDLTTANIDNIATNGVTFKNGLVNAPVYAVTLGAADRALRDPLRGGPQLRVIFPR